AVMVNERFETSVENLKIAIGETLSPTIADLKSKGIDILETITEVIEQNPQLVAALAGGAAAITTLAIAATGAAAAVALLRFAFGDVSAVTVLAVTGIAAAGGAMAGLALSSKEATESLGELTAEYDQQIESSKEVNQATKDYIETSESQGRFAENLAKKIENLNAKEKLSAEVTRLEERKETVCRDTDNIIRQLMEVYELTRSEAVAAAEKIDDMIAAQAELTTIKNKIRALGSVNVDAIEEYKEVSERYRFMSEQIADVQKSKTELEKIITDLTSEMCRIFSESFEIINSNFKSIFVELFGGGKAELILTDPENVLESGIEISVAPPGKVIKNLISLSGGEQSFVAIAIYFAILKLRPAPFCILDEIDAALDEVNVRKYAQYLKKFTDTTQFVLVTHRRSAMEEANVLYGVTMQEDGISKLLKMEQVDFQEDVADIQ
ncbi:MAG: phage tail tape measure protein, partial [Ruminococcus sp.]|nr:phage tail tape measure protein [Ruminococcus sp.]